MKFRIDLLGSSLPTDTNAHASIIAAFIETQEILTVNQYAIDTDSIIIYAVTGTTEYDCRHFYDKYKEYFNKCQSGKKDENIPKTSFFKVTETFLDIDEAETLPGSSVVALNNTIKFSTGEVLTKIGDNQYECACGFKTTMSDEVAHKFLAPLFIYHICNDYSLDLLTPEYENLDKVLNDMAESSTEKSQLDNNITLYYHFSDLFLASSEKPITNEYLSR